MTLAIFGYRHYLRNLIAIACLWLAGNASAGPAEMPTLTKADLLQVLQRSCPLEEFESGRDVVERLASGWEAEQFALRSELGGDDVGLSGVFLLVTPIDGRPYSLPSYRALLYIRDCQVTLVSYVGLGSMPEVGYRDLLARFSKILVNEIGPANSLCSADAYAVTRLLTLLGDAISGQEDRETLIAPGHNRLLREAGATDGEVVIAQKIGVTPRAETIGNECVITYSVWLKAEATISECQAHLGPETLEGMPCKNKWDQDGNLDPIDPEWYKE